MTIPEDFRDVQVASLARHALMPLIERYRWDIHQRLVSFTTHNSPVPDQKVWVTLGKLAACEELLDLVTAAEARNTRLTK